MYWKAAITSHIFHSSQTSWDEMHHQIHPGEGGAIFQKKTEVRYCHPEEACGSAGPVESVMLPLCGLVSDLQNSSIFFGNLCFAEENV